VSDHQHNHEGCDCIDPAECNCECHIIQAADALAEAAKDYLYSPVKPCCLAESSHAHYDPVLKSARKALAAYEKARGHEPAQAPDPAPPQAAPQTNDEWVRAQLAQPRVRLGDKKP
jgi:hypothetical protein